MRTTNPNILSTISIYNTFSAYSPSGDLKMFQKIMPAFSISVQMLQAYLDLQAFWQKLTRIPSFKFPYAGKHFHPRHLSIY